MFKGGLEVELLNELKQFFNFQYDVVDCNQVWGNYINGTWTGIIDKVFYKVNLLLLFYFVINELVISGS